MRAALQEDADAIALSSYQGGHVEYFKYMVDMLKERGAAHIRVFGGGGGTITPEEIRELQAYGVERIYHPNDGMHMGLVAMIEDVVARARSGCTRRPRAARAAAGARCRSTTRSRSARCLTAIEEGHLDEAELARLRKEWQLAGGKTPVVGITGTGGAGKSRVVDELLMRFLHAFPADAHRGARGRSDAPPHRRRAARRPHPHELAAQPIACSCARWRRAASTPRPTSC